MLEYESDDYNSENENESEGEKSFYSEEEEEIEEEENENSEKDEEDEEYFFEKNFSKEVHDKNFKEAPQKKITEFNKANIIIEIIKLINQSYFTFTKEQIKKYKLDETNVAVSAQLIFRDRELLKLDIGIISGKREKDLLSISNLKYRSELSLNDLTF